MKIGEDFKMVIFILFTVIFMIFIVTAAGLLIANKQQLLEEKFISRCIADGKKSYECFEIYHRAKETK